jgi:hypothetical protein
MTGCRRRLPPTVLAAAVLIDPSGDLATEVVGDTAGSSP